jgi:16S rRNA (cytosine967-C5)-methyltransferase
MPDTTIQYVAKNMRVDLRLIAEMITPGARVLDLCAGAGGKSLALAALGARVQAWDVRTAALHELDRRARRAGLEVAIGPPRGRYDVVLVDAPCSGTGVLRRHPENRWKLRFPTDTQAELLARAMTMAPRVVYATCSLARRENEDLVRRVAGNPRREATLWPAVGEGFYWAEL